MASGPMLAGVLGWPVAHSLSPRLHGYWLRRYGIEGAYVALPVQPEDLGAVIATLPKMGFAGCNLTLPHKEAVWPYLDSVDETAEAIGAVNTVVIDSSGKLHGTNTDAYGFAENIRPQLTGKNKAVILGAGGAAKAVAYALRQEGFSQIIVTNRTLARAQALAQQFPYLDAAPWEQRDALLAGADLLVNTTSLGLHGGEALALELRQLPREALVTDIVYAPLVTPLLAQARGRGNPTVDGLGMLLHQGVPAFEAWFGVRPEVDAALRAAVLGA